MAVRGRLVVVAIHATPPPVNLFRMFWRELTLIGARVYDRSDFEEAIRLLHEGAVPAARLITRIEPLSRVAAAFDALESGEAMKILHCLRRGELMAMFDLTGSSPWSRDAGAASGWRWPRRWLAQEPTSSASSQQLEAEASEVQQRVEATGRTFAGHCVDFADRVAVQQFASELGSGGRPVDILVNNAGTIARSAAVDHDDDAWDTVLEVNLTAPFVLTRELGKGMVERGSGKVIFTASLLSFQGGIRVPSYTAAKSGIAGPRACVLERVGGAGGERQRHRARLHRDRRHAGTPKRPRPQPVAARADPGRALGQTGGSCRGHGLSGLARSRLRVRSDHPGRRWLARAMTSDGVIDLSARRELV